MSPLIDAQNMLTGGDHVGAYRTLQACTSDMECEASMRSEAWQAMGGLIQAFPELDPEDQSGYHKFTRSLQLNRDNLWARLGIVMSFGPLAIDHQDRKLASDSAAELLSRLEEIPSPDRELVVSKIENERLSPAG